MLRGIIYYLFVWAMVSAALYLYGKLNKREKSGLIRSALFGLATATVALLIVLLMVYLF